MEGRDAAGSRVLLQVVRLRRAVDDEGRAARQAVERRVARATTELLTEPLMGLSAHGGADDTYGGRVLFWAFPFPRARPLSRFGEPRLDVPTLLSVARAIAERLVASHALGRVDPLLSEGTVAWDDLEGPVVLGVPIAVDPQWSDERPLRAAPRRRTAPPPPGTSGGSGSSSCGPRRRSRCPSICAPSSRPSPAKTPRAGLRPRPTSSRPSTSCWPATRT